MIQGLTKTTSITVLSIHHRKKRLKCGVRLFTLWNLEKNECHFTSYNNDA